MIDTKELRSMVNGAQFESFANSVIHSLLDHLEAAENKLETERMRLAACSVAALGYFDGCAKEYTSASLDDVLNLRKRLEAAEKELVEIRHGAAVANDTIKALQAKVEQMERQEPECEVVGQVRNVLYEVRTLKYDLPAGTKLYALPGAQGEEK